MAKVGLVRIFQNILAALIDKCQSVFYRYRHNGVKYEIDALLEFYYERIKDSGNDSLV